MLARGRDLIGYDVRGPEGSLGRIDELLVDPDEWRVTYLRIRSLLLVPAWLGPLSLFERTLETPYTARQLASNPPVLVGARVSLDTLAGSPVEADDGPAGELIDVYVDSASWHVTHAAVSLRTLGTAREVALDIRHVAAVDLTGGKIHVRMPRHQVAALADVDPAAQVGPAYKIVVDAYTRDPLSGLGHPGG